MSFVLFVPLKQSNIYELPDKTNKRSAEIRPEFTRRWANKLQLLLQLCNWQISNGISWIFCKRFAGFSSSSPMGLRLWSKVGNNGGSAGRGGGVAHVCVWRLLLFTFWLYGQRIIIKSSKKCKLIHPLAKYLISFDFILPLAVCRVLFLF